jgi:amino acid adenylation domain-containing protein
VLWDHLPRPVQVVWRRATLPVQQIQLDPDRDTIEELKECMEPHKQRLDLGHAPLMRLQIAPASHGTKWYALLQLHHLLCDNQSLNALLAEVTACLEGNEDGLATPGAYRAHVAQVLAHAAAHDADAFFRSKLADIDEPTAPFGIRNTLDEPGAIRTARSMVGQNLAKKIRSQARRHGVSAATLFHAAWAIVVARTSVRDDVVFGTVLLGRMQDSASVRDTLGLFINTLPLRIKLQNTSAKGLVEQTQRELVDLLTHEQASLAVAQRCSGISGSNPLFSSLLNYRHGVSDFESDFGRRAGVTVVASHRWTNYPVLLSVDEGEDDFGLVADTDQSIEPERLAAYMQKAMSSLIDALESSPETPAMALTVLPESERHRTLNTFNATEAQRREQLIHDLFEAQVRRSPHTTALIHEDKSLTYSELSQSANQLARSLFNQGVGPGQLVGICVERSIEMVIAVLAVLKAGGAYLPLDPNYPAERLHQMLKDAAPRLILTHSELVYLLPDTTGEVLAVDERLGAMADHIADPIPAAELNMTASDLVYVIYTSGSTGRPKGTAMSHRSMVNLIEWHRSTFRAAATEHRVLQFAALSFDVAFQEIFSTLCTGGTLVLVDEWVRRDSRALALFLSRQSIQRLFVPPLMLQAIAEFCRHRDIGLALKDIITAGEQLRISPEVVSFFERLPGCRLHNHYGPTETHVVTALTLSADPTQWPAFPSIGRPIDNTRIYVLDARRQPVPIGVTGEIYIGGMGVARGYLGQPELTRQRFLADPFSADPAARMYKTGDLGRWLADGTLEYLGRNDGQVKIRGYRVEVGEVEAQLARHAQVKEAAVVAREDVPGQRRLVAYITCRDQNSPGVEELRVHLKAVLPEYMVPSAIVTLEALPLTPSGKLDRRALPAPELDAYANQAYEPPQGQTEELLAAIWQELLRVERVGRHDNFFELGGHSLLATRVVAHIHERLHVEISVRKVFDAPTVESLAVAMSAELGSQAERESLWMSDLSHHFRHDIGRMQDEDILAEIAELRKELGNAARDDSRL